MNQTEVKDRQEPLQWENPCENCKWMYQVSDQEFPCSHCIHNTKHVQVTDCDNERTRYYYRSKK